MKDFQSHEIELDAEMLRFLQGVAKKHMLADVGKAVRCLINYARENPDKSSEIFDEVRCLEC